MVLDKKVNNEPPNLTWAILFELLAENILH